MTDQEQIEALEKKVEELENLTAMMHPLGPTPKQQYELEAERANAVERMVTKIKKAEAKDREIKLRITSDNPELQIGARIPPVDRTARVLTDGSPVTEDHREIDPATGMQKGYVVLSEEERAKGFVRPVRRAYKHKTCGMVTTMGLALAETYARDPQFYSGTFCCYCHTHYPLDQFVWDGTNEQVGL